MRILCIFGMHRHETPAWYNGHIGYCVRKGCQHYVIQRPVSVSRILSSKNLSQIFRKVQFMWTGRQSLHNLPTHILTKSVRRDRHSREGRVYKISGRRGHE